MSVVSGIGVIFFALSCYFLVDGLALIMRCKGKTTGELVVMRAQNDYDRTSRICYSPVYSYEVDGVKYMSAAKSYTTHPENYEMGTKATVRYCLGAPEICVINNRNGKTGIAILFAVIGAFVYFIGTKSI